MNNDDAPLGAGFGLPEPVVWLTPWEYPSAITDELATRIAESVRGGATLKAAAMKEGVSPPRASEWLFWGEEAYNRDAGANDYRASYLNFYLKMMQAVGLATVPVEQAMRAMNPGWWLSHHPEVRGEWGGDSEQASVAASNGQIEPNAPAALPPGPKPEVEKLRMVMKMLIESGAALPSIAERERANLIVDADASDDERRDGDA